MINTKLHTIRWLMVNVILNFGFNAIIMRLIQIIKEELVEGRSWRIRPGKSSRPISAMMRVAISKELLISRNMCLLITWRNFTLPMMEVRIGSRQHTIDLSAKILEMHIRTILIHFRSQDFRRKSVSQPLEKVPIIQFSSIYQLC